MRTPRRQNMMGPKNQGSGEKAKDFKSAIKRLIKELASLRGIIVFALILAIISAILSIAAPNKLSSITDVISEGLVINKENAEILAKTIQKNITKATEEMQAQLTIEIPAGFEMQNIDETNMDSDLSAMPKPELPEIDMNGIKVSSEDQYEFIEQMSLLDENTEISDIYGEIDASRSEYGILWGHMADILSSHNKSVGIGQCTGFVFARVYEETGIEILVAAPLIFGFWYDHAKLPGIISSFSYFPCV